MTAGSVLGTLAVLGWSQARTVTVLYAVFAAIGLASAMTLYEPAFAVLIHHVDARRRANALLAVTIVAGFASSIFFPLAGLLDSHFGWRGALVVLAAVHAVGTIPLHLALPRHAPHRTTIRRAGGRAEVVSAALHDPGFWLLAVAFLAHSAAVATIAVHLVTYLVTLGHPPAFAATITGLLGVLSVTGRLVTTGLRRRYATTAVTAAVFGLQGLAAAALPLTGHTPIGATACVVTFGIGFGVGTISRPALLTDRYDTAVYATLAGAIATPATIAKAAAPLGAAALSVAAGTYTPVLVAVAAACTIAATALLLTGRQPATHASPGHSRA
jgi:predicted MFS family arabinose efflux permease